MSVEYVCVGCRRVEMNSAYINSSNSLKRKALIDISNLPSDEDVPLKSDTKYDAVEMLPVIGEKDPVLVDGAYSERFQNVHPLIGWYKHDLNTGILSYDQLMNLMNPDNDIPLMNLLTEIGVISTDNQCLLCGGPMRKVKEGPHWFWICTRRVNGVKCNKGKKSVRTGTFLGNSHLSIQDILQVVWHFVHHLSEKQCLSYTKLSSKGNNTIVKWYRVCRDVCTNWFWNPVNTPKLGGYGTIVEMDETYFPGMPKYNKGRCLGEDSWEDDQKWGFGLAQSLDAIIEQVPSRRARADLIPIIDKYCLDVQFSVLMGGDHTTN